MNGVNGRRALCGAVVVMALTAACSAGSPDPAPSGDDSGPSPSGQVTPTDPPGMTKTPAGNVHVAPPACDLITAEGRRQLAGADLPFVMGDPSGMQATDSGCEHRRDPRSATPAVVVTVSSGAEASTQLQRTLTNMTNDPDLTAAERTALRLLAAGSAGPGHAALPLCDLQQRMVTIFQGRPGPLLTYAGRSTTDATRTGCQAGHLIVMRVHGAEPDPGAFDSIAGKAVERFRSDVLPKPQGH